MPDFNSEARLRAVAANAVREAMLVYGRWDRPFTDDDAARIENIYHILHLADPQSGYEHANLAPAKDPSVEASMREIAGLLGKLPDNARAANSIFNGPEMQISAPDPLMTDTSIL